MKALIRIGSPSITENMDVAWIDWNTGMPLTSPAWAGGSYTLVQNYVPQEDTPESYEEIVVEPAQIEVEDEDDYVIIDGKRYSKEELRALL